MFLKSIFATAIVIVIITNSESDIIFFFEFLSTLDSEPGEECDSESDLKIEDALLVFLKSRDSVPFSLSQLSVCVSPSSSISELS